MNTTNIATASPRLPPSRAGQPAYIAAFERFTRSTDDRIEAFVAYGLFISSEYEWASKQLTWPTEEAVTYVNNRMLREPEVEKTIAAAKSIVEDHRRRLVTAHEERYLNQNWVAIEARVAALVAKSSRRRFLKGVSEATVGAFCWMTLSVMIAMGAALMGIDLLHGVSAVAQLQAAKGNQMIIPSQLGPVARDH